MGVRLPASRVPPFPVNSALAPGPVTSVVAVLGGPRDGSGQTSPLAALANVAVKRPGVLPLSETSVTDTTFSPVRLAVSEAVVEPSVVGLSHWSFSVKATVNCWFWAGRAQRRVLRDVGDRAERDGGRRARGHRIEGSVPLTSGEELSFRGR